MQSKNGKSIIWGCALFTRWNGSEPRDLHWENQRLFIAREALIRAAVIVISKSVKTCI